MKRVLLIKYGEIALRRGNRHIFEKKLANTIYHLINDSNVRVTREQGRILVEDEQGDIDLKCIQKIKRIFGIDAICISYKLTEASIESLKQAALFVYKNADLNKSTFKIETKRSDKNYPLTSQQVSAAVGEYVLNAQADLKVNVHNPDLLIWIEIRNSAYVYAEVVQCEAGLPYGSTGKGILLLSGGIDSPVAGYMMARRGVEIVPVYFHSPPHTSERAKEKVLDIMERLSNYIGETPLHVVNFTEIQLYIYKNMPPTKLTIFLKRAMLHISNIIAEKEHAHCLITGDSVGQVASQTVQSIAAIDSASERTILRPLSAMNKQEIVDIAKKIDTYDISIRPYEDCCTIFVPKHPETKPHAKAVAKIEAKHSVLIDMYKKSAEEVELMNILS